MRSVWWAGTPTAPPVQHLHDGGREVAHPVGAPLLVVDVTLPAAIRVLLQHLQRGGSRHTLSLARSLAEAKEVTGSPLV